MKATENQLFGSFAGSDLQAIRVCTLVMFSVGKNKNTANRTIMIILGLIMCVGGEFGCKRRKF